MCDLSTSEIMTALAAGHDDWSASHIYFKVQSISLRITGPIGTTIIFLIGAGHLFAILKNATSTAYSWFTSIAGSALAFFSSAETSILGVLGRLPGLIGLRDAVRDSSPAGVSPDVLINVLSSSLPPMFASIPAAIAAGLGTNLAMTTSGLPSMTPTLAASGTTTAKPAAAVATATAAASNAIAAGGSNSLASDLATGGSIASTLTGLLGTSGLSGLFSGSSSPAASGADAGTAASDLSTSLDNSSSTTLDSLNAGLSDGSLSATDLTNPTDPNLAIADESVGGAAIRHLIEALGPANATKVVHSLVTLARSTKGDYAALRRNNSSTF